MKDKFGVIINHLKSLAIFVHVAEAGSFRSASKQLNLSPSVISEHISSLEKQLGVALVYRSTRTLTLTHDGEELLKSARKMLEAATHSLNKFSKSAEGNLIELRITIASPIVYHPLFNRISQFGREHPGIKMTVCSSDQVSDILKEKFDVAIRMGKLPDSSLKAKKIAEIERITVAAPDYISKRDKPYTPGDLQDWDLIGFSPVPNYLTFHKDGSKTQLDWDQTSISVDSIEARRKLAVAGFGIAGIPGCVIEQDLKQKKLVKLLPDWSGELLKVYLVWPRNSGLNPVTRQFIEFMSKTTKI